MRRVSLSVLLLYQRVQPPVYKLQPHPTLTFTRLSYQRRSQGSFIFATRFTKSSNFLLAKVSQTSLRVLTSQFWLPSVGLPYLEEGRLPPPCNCCSPPSPTPPTPPSPPPSSHSTPCMSLGPHYPCDRQDSWSVIGRCVDQWESRVGGSVRG